LNLPQKFDDGGEKMDEALQRQEDKRNFQIQMQFMRQGNKFRALDPIVGKLPSLYFKFLSLENTDITIAQRVIEKTNNEKHKICFEYIDNIIDYIAQPAAVFKSLENDKPNSLLVLTEIEDIKNQETTAGEIVSAKEPSIIVLTLGRDNRNKEVVKIESIYGLGDYYLKKYFNQADRLYYDKEKALRIINKFKLFGISASLLEGNDLKSNNILAQEQEEVKDLVTPNA
jgi:hypothetical protein